jgi:hypothetical protein
MSFRRKLTSPARPGCGPKMRMPLEARHLLVGARAEFLVVAAMFGRGRWRRGSPSPRARPMAPEMSGVPASNLCGIGFHFQVSLETDARNHVAAALPGRHGFEDFLAAIQDADARGSAHFVAGEGEEIAADLLHIQQQVPGALRGVHQVTTPRRRARAQSSATGLIVPSVLEMCVIAKSRTAGRQERVEPAQVEQSVVAGDGQVGEFAPVRSARSCHGTMLLWCSISVSRMRSPGLSRASPRRWRRG